MSTGTKTIRLAILGLMIGLLVGCAAKTQYAPRQGAMPKPFAWLSEVNLHPKQWAKQGDSWFPDNHHESDQAKAPPQQTEAHVIVAIKTAPFKQINSDLPFNTQIIGGQDHPSIHIMGPAQLAQRIFTHVKHGTLTIYAKGAVSASDAKRVMVRIGVKNLDQLTVSNTGSVTGKFIHSNNLKIKATGSGNIYLRGNYFVESIQQKNKQIITLFNAKSRHLNIHSIGGGQINISGTLNVKKITSRGSDWIRLFGVDSQQTDIITAGATKLALVGYTGLRQLKADDQSQVYIYWVKGQNVDISALQDAKIGLAGSAKNMRIRLNGTSSLEARYLRAQKINIKTSHCSQANVQASQQVVASAIWRSTIYFYGEPSIISQYTSGSGWCYRCGIIVNKANAA